MYHPFEYAEVPTNTCFFTGDTADIIEIPVFPEWLMNRYDLQFKTMKMLAENRMEYGKLWVPCAQSVYNQYLAPLDERIQSAFEKGFATVKDLPQLTLFQWMAKVSLGVLYQDIKFGLQQQMLTGEEFHLSWLLRQKFTHLHSMMQSLFVNMEFENFVPWSIEVVPVNYSKDVFNYRDEPKNLNFSLGMNGFGIVACLQDNGHVGARLKQITGLIADQPLHAIQFEELCAHYIYTNYLLIQSSAYVFQQQNDRMVVFAVEGEHEGEFREWDDKAFSQVLANYWAPWGFTSQDIYTFPDSPVSYLINDYTNAFIPAESLDLPG